MKLSVVKVLTLYSVLYLLFNVGVLLVALVYTLVKGFSFPAVGQVLMRWETQWWWLSVIGVCVHAFAYLRALKRWRLMIGNAVCIWAFVCYALIPNYCWLIALFHAGAVWAIMTYHRPVSAPSEEVPL